MKVSVCMATFNGEKYLRAQLDSILMQLNSHDELIISDDGSTDGTKGIIASYQDPRIKVFHSTHKNLILNFENALRNATGELIFLSDQDDIWFPDKVEKYKFNLNKNQLVFSNAKVFKESNQHENKLFFRGNSKKTGLLNNLIKVKFLGCTLAFKRTVLQKALPFPKNIPMHDIWIGLIAETLGKTFYIDEPLIYYRRHENAASSAGAKSTNSIFTKLKMRANLLVSLGLRQITTAKHPNL